MDPKETQIDVTQKPLTKKELDESGVVSAANNEFFNPRGLELIAEEFANLTTLKIRRLKTYTPEEPKKALHD